MQKKEVQVVALSTSETSPGNFSLVLEEMEGDRRLSIIIGAFEAQSIAIHLERMKVLRPLTHDLLKTVITELNAVLKEVFIHSLHESFFHATILLVTTEGKEKKIDARASDALSLAIRFDAPVYVSETLLQESGLVADSNRTSLLKGSLADYSLEELESLLKDILAKEDYESATRIRDMIKRRGGS